MSVYKTLQKNISKGIGITGGLREQMDCVTLWLGHRLAQSNISSKERKWILSILFKLYDYCKSQQPPVMLTVEEMRFLLLPLLYQNGDGMMTGPLDILKSVSRKEDVILIVYFNSSSCLPLSISRLHILLERPIIVRKAVLVNESYWEFLTIS